MDNSIVLEQIIRNATVIIDPVIITDDEVLLPGLFKYWYDEDGHPHKCND